MLVETQKPSWFWKPLACARLFVSGTEIVLSKTKDVSHLPATILCSTPAEASLRLRLYLVLCRGRKLGLILLLLFGKCKAEVCIRVTKA